MKKKLSGESQLKQENESLKGQLARALADYDNLRKRTEREREEMHVLVLAKLVMRLLPVIDNFDHVQTHLKDPGLAIAIAELQDGLKNEGVLAIVPSIGELFDENVHEVVEITENPELENNSVSEVILPGWKVKEGMVIRPAKVKVNKTVNQ